MLEIYTYQACSTCRNAVKWLKQHAIPFEEKAIRETPPTVAELGAALKARGGGVRSLCNTSGQDYRALGLKDTLPTMKEADALKLLAGNGNLVKRPFAFDKARKAYLVGFQEEEWKKALAD